MSAITGIFLRDGRKLKTEEIRKMNEHLNHRGPNGSSIWIEDSVGLGHQMMFTTPESLHEHLPFEEDGLIITADARIDNRKELSEKLGIRNIEEISDSYFILKAYQKWGEDCPKRLLGDFAFAIWDKNKEELFCARDHMGVKPFYYYITDEIFLFASEIKAIIEMLRFKPKFNDKMIAKAMILLFDDKKSTFYENIIRLTPAHYFKITEKNNRIERYWSLNPDYKLNLDDEQSYYKTFLNIFTDAVRCRLRSAYNTGSQLSGGVDSSSVVSVVYKILKEESSKINFHTYTTFNEGLPEDERVYVNYVLRDRPSISSHFIDGNAYSPLLKIKDILWYSDRPFSPPNYYLMWVIYSHAKKEDVRILLNGRFGDEVLTVPKPTIKEVLFKNFHWNEFYKILRSYSADTGFIRAFLILVVFPVIPNFIRKIIQRFKHKSNNLSFFEKNFAMKTDIYKIQEIYNKERYEKRKTIDGAHYYALNSATIPNALEFDSNVSNALNVEMRYPFLDKRVVEFCYYLPSEIKIKNGWKKYIIRQSLTGILPKEIQLRKDKSNYSNSFYLNLFNFEKDNIEKLILRNKVLLKDFLDVNSVLSLVKQFQNGDLYEENLKGNYDGIMTLWEIILLTKKLENNEKSNKYSHKN